MAPLYSIVTAVGRPEYLYLEQVARSLLPLANDTDTDGCRGIQWVLGVDTQAMTTLDTQALSRLPVVPVITLSTSAQPSPAAARNAALRAATGKWLVTLDSDDIVHADAVIALRAAAEAHGTVWAAGRTRDIDTSGRVLWDGPADWRPAGVVPAGEFLAHRYRSDAWPFHCSATLVHTTTVREIGGWPEHPLLTRSEDAGLWAVISGRYEGTWVPQVVLDYRKHPVSLTSSKAQWATLDERLPVIEDMVRAGSTSHTEAT